MLEATSILELIDVEGILERSIESIPAKARVCVEVVAVGVGSIRISYRSRRMTFSESISGIFDLRECNVDVGISVDSSVMSPCCCNV